MSTISNALKWLKKEARGTSLKMTANKMTFACTVYHIWSACNRNIFENEQPIADIIMHKITYVDKNLFSLYPQVLISFENILHRQQLFSFVLQSSFV